MPPPFPGYVGVPAKITGVAGDPPLTFAVWFACVAYGHDCLRREG